VIQFILRRLLGTLPVLLGVTFLVVAATKLIPGSPGSMRGQKLGKEAIAAIDAKYGYDRSLVVQYGRYVGRVAHGDLGDCWIHERPVWEELKERFPATIELACCAMVIATVLGIALGVIAATKPRGFIDWTIMLFALVGLSMPIFWLGVLLQLQFPINQRLDFDNTTFVEWTGFYVIDALHAGDVGLLGEVLRHLLLPSLALATIPLATTARLTRSSLLETLQQDYIRTARAKGLPPHRVVLKHGLRNALIPIVTAVGLQLAALLGGAVLTETVFSWPGVGSYIVEAAINKDLPALQGAVLVVSLVYIVANVLVDVSYGLIDPRVRVE
jgi:ABC-type dipeptide/oligopeptide/nickel transport system permease component